MEIENVLNFLQNKQNSGQEFDNFSRIFNSFNDKLLKLNSDGCSSFLYNYLFVHSEILADQEMIDKAIIDMDRFQEKYAKKFYRIFVYVPSELYILDLMDKGRTA